ncbi:14078_t:CDS:2 [Funneliformis mosseae]|uniref:14078_t:CDS:1 n=1 Tax=Funneliformis mosseae TaxID=27381 RepID=A0A9N9DX85_FUNMO|nr:14078_t:CDS:2 [Funneliformis mosseae]
MPNSPMSPTLRERLDFPGSQLLNRLKKLRHFTTDKWLTRWILLPTMGFAFILALIIQIFTPELSLASLKTDCKIGPQSIPILILIAAFLVIICPILFYLLYDLRDAYGLRNELLVTLFSCMFAYAGYFVFELLLPRWRNYFGSLMFAWITFILCHTFSITMPVIRSFKDQSDSIPNSRSFKRDNNKVEEGKFNRHALFEKVLGDSELFEHYKICAATCFCTELIIFLQEYQFLKMLVAHCCTPSSKGMIPPSTPKLYITETGHISFIENHPEPITSPSLITTPCTKSIAETVSAASWIPFPHELRADYDTFYETFFDMDSDLAINFPGNLLNSVKSKISNEKYDLNMYEQARDEVLNLLYRNTFDRFLKVCEPELTKRGL